MGITDFLLNLVGITKVYRLRRKYDRVREKADKIRNRLIRVQILSVLDSVEQPLEMLEEQKLTRYERKRLVLYVESGIEKAKRMLERKEELVKNLYNKQRV